jgi:putative addiction module component (TIGR02574 family)
VTEAAKKLLEEVLALPDADQEWLVARLLDYVPRESQAEIDAAWRDEALRRADELERGQGQTLDGRAAVTEIEQELRALRSR